MISGVILIIASTAITLLSLWESEFSKTKTKIPENETEEEKRTRLEEKLQQARTIRVKIISSVFVVITLVLMLWELDAAEDEKELQHLQDAQRYSRDSLIHVSERAADSAEWKNYVNELRSRFTNEESNFTVVNQSLVKKSRSDSAHYKKQQELSDKLIKTQEVLIDSMVDHFNQLNLPLSPMELSYQIRFDGKQLGNNFAKIKRRALQIVDQHARNNKQQDGTHTVIEEYDKSFTVMFESADVLDSVMGVTYVDMRLYQKLDYGERILDFCMNRPGYRATFTNKYPHWTINTKTDEVIVNFTTSKEDYITTVNGMSSIGQLPGSFLSFDFEALEKFELHSIAVISGDTKRVFCKLELEAFYNDPVVKECGGQWYKIKGIGE
ncbi:hypothetical protein KK083_20225 [Fulvivirgaceae bacterium PWU4]|uniref:Uncharacterized protein n=1 Tax=Chryseosolibacter histidini TaxID=2782349 RepID=A0AAP2GQR5_9BACT|nr:hypothetical protein [Chryseosolibacter histidini]MBT1699235.1 hypothetical protein [Chryseosolibacter histidini]